MDWVADHLVCKIQNAEPHCTFPSKTLLRVPLDYPHFPRVTCNRIAMSFAEVAQLVEQRFCKAKVVGSTPILGFYF